MSLARTCVLARPVSLAQTGELARRLIKSSIYRNINVEATKIVDICKERTLLVIMSYNAVSQSNYYLLTAGRESGLLWPIKWDSYDPDIWPLYDLCWSEWILCHCIQVSFWIDPNSAKRTARTFKIDLNVLYRSSLFTNGSRSNNCRSMLGFVIFCCLTTQGRCRLYMKHRLCCLGLG